MSDATRGLLSLVLLVVAFAWASGIHWSPAHTDEARFARQATVGVTTRHQVRVALGPPVANTRTLEGTQMTYPRCSFFFRGGVLADVECQ